MRSGDVLWYRIELCGAPLLIEAALGCELVEGAKPRALPNTPGWFLGLFGLRGDVIPVFDVQAWVEVASVGCSRLASTRTDTQASRLLVVGREELRAALPIVGFPVPVHESRSAVRCGPADPAAPSLEPVGSLEPYLDRGHPSALAVGVPILRVVSLLEHLSAQLSR
ncbi:MAG: chemotaxis protein CheW [Gammaproteobacteria bacterium]|nr:chemotaxis protein CheW [Gammaproteobacteria bacterium]